MERNRKEEKREIGGMKLSSVIAAASWRYRRHRHYYINL